MNEEFKEFVNNLIKDISTYNLLSQNLQEAKENSYNNEKLYLELFEEYENSWIKEIDINNKLDKLYKKSIVHNYYYFDCPLIVYKKIFKQRLGEFIEINIDADETDFIKAEVEEFNTPSLNRYLKGFCAFNLASVTDYSSYREISNKKYSITLEKKIDFLSKRLNQFGFKIEISTPEAIYDGFYQTKTIIPASFIVIPLDEKDVILKNENQNKTEHISTLNLKLQTELSVPQLSLLFKMINDLKPTIFKTESNAELFRFISANFKTKQSSEKGISTNKLSNQFSAPDLKAIEFWEKHLHTMLAQLRNLK